MHIVKIEETFENSIEKLWDLVSNLENQLWRRDIERIEIIDSTHFIEHDRSGFQTEFTIVNKVEYEVYEFDLKNDNIEGHWTGQFKVLSDQSVHVKFTEEIDVKKKIMNLIAKSYLRQQQRNYIEDLKKELQK